MRNLINIIFVFVIVTMGCDNKPPVVPNPNPIDTTSNEPIFELIWATILDPSKEEVFGSQNVFVHNDLVITGGDENDPASIICFDKHTGDLANHVIHNSSNSSRFFTSDIIDNTLIGVSTSKGIYAFDLDLMQVSWEIDYNNNGLDYNWRGGQEPIERNGNFVLNLGKNGESTSGAEIVEFDKNTGAYEIFYTTSPVNSLSTPVFWVNPDDGKEYLICNEYELEGAISPPPPIATQSILAVDMESKEEIWRTDYYTDFYASSFSFPPVIYNNEVLLTGGDWSMYGFNIRTGEKLWRTQMPTNFQFGNWTNTNYLLKDNRLYAIDGGKESMCINAQTGELIWHNANDASNCANNMVYYKDMIIIACWGKGSIIILDAFTGELIHKEPGYENSYYRVDAVYDDETDMFYTTTFEHAVAFKINKPK